MENKSAYDEKLKKYTLEDSVLYTGFANFSDAELYAQSNGGQLVEVGFKDGNDNPVLTSEAQLIETQNHYAVDAGQEYTYLHSADPRFRDFADELQRFKSTEIEELSPEEKYITNAEIEVSEDPIIVLKNGEFDSVTSRERSKYLRKANVYEIAVRCPLSSEESKD